MRTSEVRQARWSEIDLITAVWTIPAERMKADREHRVPLSPGALNILQALDDDLDGEVKWVFSAEVGKHLSSMALPMMLRRMKRGDITVHGFRSSFRDWAVGETVHAREVAEAVLAHISGEKVERAYQRGDFLEKRRLLMDAWDRFAHGKRPLNKAIHRSKHARLTTKGSKDWLVFNLARFVGIICDFKLSLDSMLEIGIARVGSRAAQQWSPIKLFQTPSLA